MAKRKRDSAEERPQDPRSHHERMVNRPFADVLSKPKTLPAPGPDPTKPVPTRTPPRPENPVKPPTTLPAPGPDSPVPVPTRTPPAFNPSYSYEDRVAFNAAFAGVKPLHGRSPKQTQASTAPVPRGRDEKADEGARQRLASLVSGGKTFRVQHADDGAIAALRSDAHKSVLTTLGAEPRIDAEIDLHGYTVNQAKRELARFVREARQNGDRVVRVIHGRGRHSAGGVASLGEAAVTTLTEGAASPFVLGLVSAPPSLGGLGALLVQLTFR